MASTLDRVRSALTSRYEVERELEHGEISVVCLARDLRHERVVAHKVLRPERTESVGTERFLREIRIAASLQHPNIVTLYDSGEADGLPYFAMQLVEGESLRDRLEREGQIAASEALRITRDVAGALDYAHAKGVVHRDVKPENILLAGDEVLVADFGVAHAASEAGGERITATGVRSRLPTP